MTKPVGLFGGRKKSILLFCSGTWQLVLLSANNTLLVSVDLIREENQVILEIEISANEINDLTYF